MAEYWPENIEMMIAVEVENNNYGQGVAILENEILIFCIFSKLEHEMEVP